MSGRIAASRQQTIDAETLSSGLVHAFAGPDQFSKKSLRAAEQERADVARAR
jgi:hypothetical protein